ncbi:MAG: PIG-L family deacetylase [Acidobacteria bacterium]|nr:PIG-L family deacetylase [Acidobacteriota bacterium]
MRRRQFLLAAAAAPKTVMVVAADARWLECCAGLVARQLAAGLRGLLVRVGDDRLEGWNMPPEQAAWRNRLEAEAAAKVLGLAEVVSFGYPASELRNVPHTTLRDRLLTLIRRHRPAVLVIPNPHTEHDRNLDSYYAGAAAEDAWHAARFANYLPALALEPYVTPEVYYYAPPVDPRRREPEAAAAFVPQPVQVDISPWFAQKLAAARELKTVNRARAERLRERLAAAGQRLPLLATVDDAAAARLAEENLRGLAALGAEGSNYALAEEFRYAGVEYGIPAKYLR